MNNMDKYTIYHASNILPPDWLLDMNDSNYNTSEMAAQKLIELGKWEHVLFIMDHETSSLIPLSKDDKNRKVQEFKYLFNL